MEGWLTKKGGRISTWRRRWFAMSSDRIDYYTDQDKKVNKGYIATKDLIEVGHILHETRSWCIGLRTEKRLYVVSCEDEQAFEQWLTVFRDIQPKELDSEFTNVPHSSIGNIEKLLFKKKKKDKEPNSRETGMETVQGPKESSSKDSPPSSSGSKATTPPESGTQPGSRSSVTGSDSAPASTSPRVEEKPTDPAPIPNTTTSSVSSGDSNGAASPTSGASLSQLQHSPQANGSSPSGSQSQTGPATASSFSALHSSFDLDLTASLNPALMASPLEESPFAEQPHSTITVPTLSPIVASDPAPEESPFE